MTKRLNSQIGIDAGSKFLKIAYIENGICIPKIYSEHNGRPEEKLAGLINKNFFSPEQIIFSGSYADQLTEHYRNSTTAEEISSIIEAVRLTGGKYRFIINVGAGSIKLIELADNCEFASYRENSLCAAGTGSFLDEQMHRMNFSYNDLENIPFIKIPPDVATRCAVFAKSDLIHRQQEGYTKEQMWSGLCRGVVSTMLQTAFRGDMPGDSILFCGGLFLNPLVRMWVREMTGKAFFHENGHYFSAMGSLMLNGKNGRKNNYIKITDNKTENARILKSPKLRNTVSEIYKTYNSNGNEVRLHLNPENKFRAGIGIDVGSTSTKLVLVEAGTNKAILDIYRKTGGNPINAVKSLFDELRSVINGNIVVTGAGTTGSGRKLIGKIIGADSIVNEITAHFKGANFFDNSIETIFEIGGQDSKYIRGYNGSVIDCNMNFVCAAGTGSFIEEQASRLGYDIADIGDMVLDIRTPHTSERCTVFMEQDINKLLREGYSREEVLAGVIYSIAKNYLSRVVGTRPVTGDRIFFQGATARNKGIVAAFESILRREIIVSPYCHVMGAFGAALIAMNKSGGRRMFRGFDVLDQNIKMEYDKCDKCANFCKITTAHLDNGISESWGFMCGKESLDDARKETTTDHFKKIFLLQKPDKEKKDTSDENSKKTDAETKKLKPVTVGLPLTLSMYNDIPLWSAFLEKLGFRVIMSGKPGSGVKERAVGVSKSEFCFPIKLSLAYIGELAENPEVEAVFYPSVLSEKNQDNGMPRMFCPYVITFPSVARQSLGIKKEIISPCIDLRQSSNVIIDDLYSVFSEYGYARDEIKSAFNEGQNQRNIYYDEKYNYGKYLLKDIKENKKTGIVCIGRPYNLYDKIINLGLTERLKADGIEVFPYEFMIDPDDNDPQVQYMYWNYGEKILNAAKKIRDIDGIYPVYFTNFSCGPDSFILSRFEEIMKGKPYLIIELDEHLSETGYLTRIEAFMDVINDKKTQKEKISDIDSSFRSSWNKRDKKLWMPFMFEIAPRFIAAGFRGFGYDAEALPLEDNQAYEFGKQNTRGSECLPACTTIGAFLKKMKEINADPSKHAFIMATAEGPCRFGQYSTMHKRVLEKNGMSEVEIFSPSDRNSYMGMDGDLRRYLLDCITASDLLSKRIYSLRPYEINKGETDGIGGEIIRDVERRIEAKEKLIPVIIKALSGFSAVKKSQEKKPLVGIVGEIYVRSNPFCNNNVIRCIESGGGEAWLSPFTEWVIYTAWMERYLARINKIGFLDKVGRLIKTTYMINRIHNFEHILKEFIPERTEPPIERVLEAGKKYVPLKFEGEVILTIGRTICFLEDGADMVVNCAPFSCMPGNITTSIFHKIQKDFNKPIINLFYDGESDANRIINVYLANIRSGNNSEISEEISSREYAVK